jgi:hypothetical protein
MNWLTSSEVIRFNDGRFAGWWMNGLRCQFLRELVLVVIEKLPGGITETGRYLLASFR